MQPVAQHWITFGFFFHFSSHSALKCKLIVKNQNCNKICVIVQLALDGHASSGHHFTCKVGKYSEGLNRNSGPTGRKDPKKQSQDQTSDQ